MGAIETLIGGDLTTVTMVCGVCAHTRTHDIRYALLFRRKTLLVIFNHRAACSPIGVNGVDFDVSFWFYIPKDVCVCMLSRYTTFRFHFVIVSLSFIRVLSSLAIWRLVEQQEIT